MEFLPRTLLYYMLSHAYLFWGLYRLTGRRRKSLVLLPLFVLMGLYPYAYHMLPTGTAQELFGRLGTLWLPAAFFALLVLVIADALSVAALALRRLVPRAALLFFSRKRYFALLLLIAACVYGYGVYEAHHLRITPLLLKTEKLPQEIQRLRIVFASDLHIGPQTGTSMLTGTVDAILAQEPDLILLGGDIFDDAFQGTADDLRELARLRAPLGSFAVLGNHDSFGGFQHAVASLSQTGIRLLSDESTISGPIRLVGLDDPDVSAQKREREQAQGRDGAQGIDPMQLLDIQAEGPELFTILLDHRPGIRLNTVGYFDLQLSGHSHGGQIFMLRPLLESVYGTPTGFSSYRSESGVSSLFVTTGTGFSKLPIRLFVPPEIVVIDLERDS